MNAYVQKEVTPPGFVFRSRLQTSQEPVSTLLNEIAHWMAQIGALDNKITNVQIVLAEVLNNVIEHGFESENSGTVEIEIKVFDDSLVIQVSDNGMEFTPPNITQTPLQDITDIDGLPEGGFGWFLIHEITSSFEFYRMDNKNYLTLVFR